MVLPEPGWEDEGGRLSPLLDTLSAIVVVGADANAAALVALGAARAQAERRRVVIGDLVGDLEALESVIPRHDPHGLADSFTYGISLNRIGYAVDTVGNLFVMPSGSEPVATRSIIGHPRWQRLVAGFREVGALLILVAEPTAPGLDALIPVTDGALLVGDTRLESPAHVISRARPRGALRLTGAAATDQPPGEITVPVLAATNGQVLDDEHALSPEAAMAAGIPAVDAAPADDRRASSRRTWAIIGITLAAAVVALAGVTATRVLAPRTVETASAGEIVAPPPVALPALSVPAAEPPPPVENPEDSSRAAAYSVVVVAANTSAGADDNLRRVSDLPAATAAPSVDGGMLWYKVFVGAFADRAQAEALRDSLRIAGRAEEIIEPIVSVPFALLIAEALPPDSIAPVQARFTAAGVATYVLMQENGTARLVAGAFATPGEAMHLAPALRAAGVQPRIVYRTGRPH